MSVKYIEEILHSSRKGEREKANWDKELCTVYNAHLHVVNKLAREQLTREQVFETSTLKKCMKKETANNERRMMV